MKVEWLFEAQAEYRSFLLFYKTKLGTKYAGAFAEKIRKGIVSLRMHFWGQTSRQHPQPIQASVMK